MKKTLFLAIILSTITYAEIGIIDLDTSPRMEIRVDMKGVMNYVGNAKDITLEMYFPQGSPWQSIEDPDLFENYEFNDQNGNMIIVYRFPSSAQKNFNYSVHLLMDPTAVDILSNPKYDWNSSDPLGIGDNFSEYLLSTEYANVTPAIMEKALEIASGKNTELEIVKEIFDWVNTRLTYTEEYVEGTLTAEEVLSIRAGVCDEYTVLFMAMLRALKIPARFIGGRAHSGLEFQYHSWAEFYVPGSGWIPVDPTFNQFGILDPLHIKFFDNHDHHSIITNLTWIKALNVEVLPPEISYTVNMVKKHPIYSPVKLNILNENLNLSRGEVVDLGVEVENLRPDYVIPTVRVVTPPEAALIDNFEKTVLLKPYEKKVLSWRMIAPSEGLKQGYTIINESGTFTVTLLYSIPVIVSSYPVKMNATFIVNPDLMPEEIRDLSIETDGWKDDGKMVVKVTLKNNGNTDLENVSVGVSSEFLGSDSTEIDLDFGTQRDILFEFSPSSEKELYDISVVASVPINETKTVEYPVSMQLYSSRKEEIKIPSIDDSLKNVTEILDDSLNFGPNDYVYAFSAFVLVLLWVLSLTVKRKRGKGRKKKEMDKLDDLELQLE